MTNNSSYSYEVESLLSLHPAFVVSDTDLTLEPQEAFRFWIKFFPRHNISHNSEVVIDLDGRMTSIYGSLSIDVTGLGKYPDPYYSSTQNKSEEALKQAISQLISGHTDLGYSGARDRMFMLIDNQRVNGQGAGQNTLEGVYTGTLCKGYSDRQDAQSTCNFNTEHTFPQGHFNSNSPMRGDLHHLFPTTVNSNSRRGNNPFGYVQNPIWQKGGSKQGSNLFEPRDAQKGDAARALFYFVLRYQDYGNFVRGQEQVLREWHELFPPDAVDLQRNNDIEQYQGNRNPFIDHPEFLERIHSLTQLSQAPQEPELYLVEDTVDIEVHAGQYDYDYVIVNRGNSNLVLHQVEFDDAVQEYNLYDESFPDTIFPGEAHAIEIAMFLQTNQATDTMLLETNDPDQPMIRVPLKMNVQPQPAIGERVVAAPELVQQRQQLLVSLPNEDLNVKILDLHGRALSSTYQGYGQVAVPVPVVPAGIYLVRMDWNGGVAVKKVFLQPLN